MDPKTKKLHRKQRELGNAKEIVYELREELDDEEKKETYKEIENKIKKKRENIIKQITSIQNKQKNEWKRNKNDNWLCPECGRAMGWIQVRQTKDENDVYQNENRIDVIECKECNILAQKDEDDYEPEIIENEEDLKGKRIY